MGGDLIVRAVSPWPEGANATDTEIYGYHYNLTALQYWNYTYYTNETFSNGSNCFLGFPPYMPYMEPNGTFHNWTTCYSAIEPMGVRADVGIAMAALFGLSLVFTMINLRKHGRRFLPKSKRFAPVGRRWQWYWMIITAACAMISGVVSVDVDRYYLPEVPVVLTNIFWFMMIPSSMAIVWESVRHWGSWQERQMIDPNPFSLKQDDRRGRIEFFMPLVFYFWNFLDFFMVVPRGWGRFEDQRSEDQTLSIAKPSATDGRFKVGAFSLFIAWCIIIYCLRHNIHHYKARNRGVINSTLGFLKYTPFKFMLTIPLVLIPVGYAAASAFDWDLNPINLSANPAWIYGLGWAPILAVIIIYEIAGYYEPNEDKELIRQRRVREAEIDQELGITKKPDWWSRIHGHNRPMNVHDQIARNVREVGGGAATTKNIGQTIEMGNMPASQKHMADRSSSRSMSQKDKESKVCEQEALRLAAQILFPNASASSERSDPFKDEPEPARAEPRGRSPQRGSGERSNSTGTQASGVTLNAKPQQVRSMLDI